MYSTDLGPDVVYSIHAAALPMTLTSGPVGLRWHSGLGPDAELGMGYSMGNNSYMQRSYRAMLDAAFQARSVRNGSCRRGTIVWRMTDP